MTTITTCADVLLWIDAYIDGELELPASVDVERHLESCAACKQVYLAREAMRSAIRGQLRYPVTPALRERLHGALQKSISSESRLAGEPASGIKPHPARPSFGARIFAPMAWSVAACLVVAALAGVFWLRNERAEDVLAQNVVPAHIRSLQVNHLTDVLSSDQHTVKPWFTGKIDFSPVVEDLADVGFPLVGGRLDYVEGHNTAALVYQRRKHTINVFVWPDNGTALRDRQAFSRDGFNVLFWRDRGLDYCAVSDVSVVDLRELAERMTAAR